jgi:hypothetical protein
MMSNREQVRALLDQVSEEALPAVARYLEAVLAGCPPDNPYDDEPLTPEEAAMMDEAREEIARGAIVTHEVLAARISARRERA